MTACSRVYEQLITSSEIITGDGMASFTRAVFAVDGCPSVRPSSRRLALLHNVQLLTVKHLV